MLSDIKAIHSTYFFSFRRFLIVLHLFTKGILELNRLGQIGNFSSGIGKKTYFLALGVGPNFGPKFRGWRALKE